MSAVQPFQFEPERNLNTEESEQGVNENPEDEHEQDERVGHTNWCRCGNCVPMLTVRESVCCQELPFISEAVQDLQCITVHPNFEVVCLNRDVLWAALVSLHDRLSAGLPSRNGVTNRSYRYASYRQFTWWMHGWLGRRVRRVIPSCTVQKIRTVYPEPSGVYTGFELAENQGEVEEAWRNFNA